ncbi:MAG: ATP-binding cassette domain-containing protein [Deltaproteobacteria bacterium]|nr:ATP-binding cassette domain-containing protein [Deltaproteobacteria bacterium]
MAQAEFDQVEKRFGAVTALAGFTLVVGDGELITVLGPSGCGKSTLLRVTAGLEPLTRGTILVGGRRIDQLPPHQRDVAMVFQNYALYPHMSVRGNIEFPLRMRGTARPTRRAQVADVAALLELNDLLERRPAQLSGGQRQRVALARALVRHPALFLLDEPLSNLDVRLRASVRRYIRQVQRRLAVTTLYVTHDQTEAMTLGDRVVVMNEARIHQVAPPLTVYQRPADTFVAGFVGTPPMNLLLAHYAGAVLTVGGQHVHVPIELQRSLAGVAGTIQVGIRPEAFQPAPDGCADLVASTVPESREPLGSETLVGAAIGDQRVTARIAGSPTEIPDRFAAPIGALHFFAEDGTRLGP